MKKCPKCKSFQTRNEFHKDSSRSDGLQVYCKTCEAKKRKTYYEKNKSKERSRIDTWKTYNPVKMRKYLLKRFNMTLTEYDTLLKAQNSKCKICLGIDRVKSLAVDHDHKTGEVRGLLCTNCNTALGKFKDNPALLERAVSYIRREL